MANEFRLNMSEMTKAEARERAIADLIENAKAISRGAEDWQFIENIELIGRYLRELDGEDID